MPIPPSSPPDPRPLILTALFEPVTQARFEAWRHIYFPPARNQVPAHLTLFHQLPGSQLDAVKRQLKQLCAATAPLPVSITGLKFTGRGVAFAVQSPELEALRTDIAGAFDTLLTLQDRQGWRPHVTVQNKVDGETAKRTFAELSTGFAPWKTRIVAVAVWRYLGGPWEALADIALRGR